MQRKITIELFRDVETPKVNPAIALPAISYINRLTNDSLELVNASRLFYVAPKAQSRIDAETTNHLVNTETDMRLVLTARGITLEGVNNPVGYALMRSRTVGGFAIVSTFQVSPETSMVAATHEIGHLFGLVHDNPHDAVHCANSRCIMHQLLPIVSPEPVAPSRYSAEYRAFCTPCSTQLAERALSILHNRNDVPTQAAVR